MRKQYISVKGGEIGGGGGGGMSPLILLNAHTRSIINCGIANNYSTIRVLIISTSVLKKIATGSPSNWLSEGLTNSLRQSKYFWESMLQRGLAVG